MFRRECRERSCRCGLSPMAFQIPSSEKEPEMKKLKRFVDDDDSKYKRESRIFKSSPLAHARNARTRALLSPFCASLLLGRKHYLRGLYALCGFIYFN